jgi:AmiR/NasT family two-component response regulator
VDLGWDLVGQYEARARVETAVGVLMELCGWEATTARSRLVSAAVSANAPVTTAAEVLLALGPELRRR